MKLRLGFLLRGNAISTLAWESRIEDTDISPWSAATWNLINLWHLGLISTDPTKASMDATLSPLLPANGSLMASVNAKLTQLSISSVAGAL